MHSSKKILQPVVTLLTRSPSSSKLIQKVFSSHFGVKPLPLHQSLHRESESVDVSVVDVDGLDPNRTSDQLDDVFRPFFNTGFHSEASIDSSGTILHFLSFNNENEGSMRQPDNDKAGATLGGNHQDQCSLSLLAVTSCAIDTRQQRHSDFQQNIQAVLEARSIIANHIQDSNVGAKGTFQMTLASMHLAARNVMGKAISPRQLLGFDNDLPLIKMPSSADSIDSNTYIEEDTDEALATRLREIVLPYSDEDTYPDGRSFIHTFSTSKLSRPKVGLYQWPGTSLQSADANAKCNNTNATSNSNGDGIVLRPLPMAANDMLSSPPTFVFQCNSLHDVEIGTMQSNKQNHESASKLFFSKVGRNSNTPGQLMLHHPLLNGLDLRYCQQTDFSPSFAEAQESLMAGSLDDLQNVNVMVEGVEGGAAGAQAISAPSNDMQNNDTNTLASTSASTNAVKVDSMNGLGDCWVEFRANMKQPLGFVRKALKSAHSGTSAGKLAPKRVAKAPNIPYE